MREGTRRALAAAVAVAAIAAGGARAPVAARLPGGFAGGTYCDSCPAPVVNTWGIEFRDGQLWTLAQDGTLTRLSATCAPAEVVSVQGFRGFATGLGWDSRRDAFVVADALLDSIEVIDPRGEILHAFVSPGSGPVGVTYDPTRDAYWITDYETHSLYAIDAATGATRTEYPLVNRFRVAGAAYDAAHDAIVYHERILAAAGFTVSCATGAVLDSFPMPFTGINGWQDNALAPDGALWVYNYEYDEIYCLDRALVPTRRTTWGALKLRYR